MLIASQQLTRLELCGQLLGGHGASAMLDPRALAGQTRLQHLVLKECILLLSARMSELLSHVQQLQQLQQLTHLSVTCSSDVIRIAGYTALTASSKLHHLESCTCGSCMSPGAAFLLGQQQPWKAAGSSAAVPGCRHCTCSTCGALQSCWPHSRG